jgi:hypothetical protein
MKDDPPDIAEDRAQGWLGEHETACDPEILRRIVRDNKFAERLMNAGLIRPDDDNRRVIVPLRPSLIKAT